MYDTEHLLYVALSAIAGTADTRLYRDTRNEVTERLNREAVISKHFSENMDVFTHIIQRENYSEGHQDINETLGTVTWTLESYLTLTACAMLLTNKGRPRLCVI